MIRLRKAFYFKVLSGVLICLFLFQTDALLSQQEKWETQFEKAKSDYLSEVYEKAASRLLRLAAAFENMEQQSTEINFQYGQTLLLLGACQEQLQQPDEAEKYYTEAKKRLSKKNFSIPGINFKKMKVYKKIRKSKEPKTTTGIITKETTKKKKKKIPILLVVGGAVVAGVVLFLLLKKSKKTLSVSKGEGINGTPESGSYKYKKNSTVNYNYSLQDGYTGLSVRLDGNEVSPSGTINMNRDHSLNATAYKVYMLTVTKGNGVSGSPDSGTYSYRDGDTVNYSYSLNSGYKDLVVKLDGAGVSSSGSFTMNGNRTLSATSTKIDQLPTVSITEPKNGDTVGGRITIKANASDDKGIKMVRFYIDGTQKETDSTSPYKCTWNTTDYSNGSHTIKATAVDTSNQTSSDQITVKVSNKQTANIDITFSPNPVYPGGDGKWHYKIYVRETNGVGAWLTGMDTDPGTWNGGTPKQLFGTDYIGPYGQLSANLVSSGFTRDTDVTFYIWGYDANGNNNLTWQGIVKLRGASSMASDTFSKQGINDKDKSN